MVVHVIDQAFEPPAPALDRKCGGCQLCCQLLPVVELNKLAGEKCRFQRFRTGCSIHDRKPMACTLWNCMWLVEPLTHDLKRPDKAGYVIDIMPDSIGIRHNDNGQIEHVPAIQIWVDPARKDKWHTDRALEAFLIKHAHLKGTVALIRFNASDAAILIPANLSSTGQSELIDSNLTTDPKHVLRPFELHGAFQDAPPDQEPGGVV